MNMDNYFLTNRRNIRIMDMGNPHSNIHRRPINGKSYFQVLRRENGNLATQGAFAMTKPLTTAKPLTLTGGECL
jgi:hypothetical protein